jgi:hypothetical protein
MSKPAALLLADIEGDRVIGLGSTPSILALADL